MNKPMTVAPIFALLTLLLGGLAVFSSGCGGGSDSGPAGTAMVQGNVASFKTGTALYLPALRGSVAERLAATLGELLIPSARAAVGGVTVRMLNTDLETTTADDGSFVMSGVPAGEQQLQFMFNGASAYMNLTVPDHATITLSNIQCQGAMAAAGHMDVHMPATMMSTMGQPAP